MSLTSTGRTVPDSNAPQLWRLTRKAVTTHAERHRGRSACDVVGWSKREAWGSRRGTTALTSRSREGVRPISFPPQS